MPQLRNITATHVKAVYSFWQFIILQAAPSKPGVIATRTHDLNINNDGSPPGLTHTTGPEDDLCFKKISYFRNLCLQRSYKIFISFSVFQVLQCLLLYLFENHLQLIFVCGAR